MADFSRALYTLEFDKIRGLLADCATTEGAKELAARLTPSADEGRVRHAQRQTSDAKRLVQSKGAPSFGRIIDVQNAVDRAEKGATLSQKELLMAANILTTARHVRDYGEADRTYPTCLDEIFSRLFVLRSLEQTIRRALPSEDTVADEASPTLADLRRKMRNANQKIKDTLAQYTGGVRSRYLQENIVTQRNGRYVIPVKAEYKNEIKGLLHDTSASGATVFIEPMAVVDANNELCELARKEQREIERILAELSAECVSVATELKLNYQNLTELAFLFAKAELSFRQNANEVAFSSDRTVRLTRARHPLLSPKTVVPIDIYLGQDYDTLVITGPNTGGKTVTLKTLGLSVLMAQSGLHICAEESSTLPIFDGVRADIGDEQSIEQSLSTFSAHMTHIVKILAEITPDSLVLFDELGAGTDPIEGAALAVAILERVRESGALCAATTHYAELKMYALDTPGVKNASCEFDLATLRPTYRLIIGSPGKSNAFAISERLGLPPEIVARANALVSGDSKRFETVIGALEAERVEMEKNRREAQQLRAQMKKKEETLAQRLAEESAKTERELEQARAKASQMLAGARAASDAIFAELDALKKKRESEALAQALEESRRMVRRTLRETDVDVDPVLDAQAENYVLPRPLRVGDRVILKNIQKEGEVVSIAERGDAVTVRTGSLLTKTKQSNLMLAQDAVAKPLSKPQRSQRRTPPAAAQIAVSRNFSYEIDLRGEYGEDAWVRVDKYLDDAMLSNMKSVRLVHGKGTGALKRALWERLKTDPRVKSYRLGAYGEGDLGVTVVELK